MPPKLLWRFGKWLAKDEETTSREGVRLTLPQKVQTASSDAELKEILQNIKNTKSHAVINYGASWCRVCNQILPAFCSLSDEFRMLSFIYADIDECPETTQAIRYTPTFHFYRDGERVDEMFGTGEDRLRDRLWLHS